jgi:uncharacterized integral membrane protein
VSTSKKKETATIRHKIQYSAIYVEVIIIIIIIIIIMNLLRDEISTTARKSIPGM